MKYRRFGKLDITGGFECRGCPVAFDGSAFANDPSGQFLNGALANNPTNGAKNVQIEAGPDLRWCWVMRKHSILIWLIL